MAESLTTESPHSADTSLARPIQIRLARLRERTRHPFPGRRHQRAIGFPAQPDSTRIAPVAGEELSTRLEPGDSAPNGYFGSRSGLRDPNRPGMAQKPRSIRVL